MIVTTTPVIVGKNILEYKGIVSGSALGAVGASGWKISLDARNDAFNNAMQAAKAKALDALMLHAQQLGANAVVGTSFTVQVSGNFLVSATGTAVVVE